jgi:hypothetical protein
MKSTQTLDKILVSGKAMDLSFTGEMTASEALESYYAELLVDRRNADPALAKKSAIQIALLDAGVGKSTKIGTVLDSTITTNTDTNEWLIPAWMDERLHESIYAQDVLQYITGAPIGVDSTVLKAATLDLLSTENKDATKRKRVSEGADLPLAKIKTGEKSVELFKHGRAVEISYEAMRRMRMDEMGKILDAIAGDISGQELSEATYVLINGDGNSNPAVDLGWASATANTITAAEFVRMCVEFYLATNLAPTTVICGKDMFRSLLTLRYDPSLVEGAFKGFGFNAPQISPASVTLITADVPQIGSKNPAIIFNKDMALNKYVENGSMIREYNANIRNQTKLGTISDVSGFAKFNANAVRYIKSA